MATKKGNATVLPFSKFVDEPQRVASASVTDASPTEALPRSRKGKTTASTTGHHGNKSVDVMELLRGVTHDSEKVKHTIRSGIWPLDTSFRPALWCRLSELMSKPFSRDEVYYSALSVVFGEEATSQGIETIKPTVLPQFVDDRFLNARHLSQAGVDALHRILRVVAYERPDITYCPLLWSVVAILLHFMTEEECYECSTAILAKRIPLHYLTQTKKSFESFVCIYKLIAKKYCKSACSYLESRHVDLDTLFGDWLLWIFNDLPFYHVVRTMDCYLYEGPKVFYRVGLAILFLYHKYRIELPKNDNSPKSIKQFCSSIEFPPSKLFKVAFGFRDLSKSALIKFMLKAEGMRLASKHKVTANAPERESVDLLVSTQTSSELMSRKEWKHIYDWLPRRVILLQPRLLFSTSEDGCSLKTFYNKLEGQEQSLLVIYTLYGDLIGSFISGNWSERKQFGAHIGIRYFGTGESFVFQLVPGPPAVYKWAGIDAAADLPPGGPLDEEESDSEANRKLRRMGMFATGDDHMISIGGGSQGQAIYLNEDLSQVTSSASDTFGNPCLLSKKDVHPISLFEAFGFE